MPIDKETLEVLKEMQKQNLDAIRTIAVEMRKPTDVEQSKIDADEAAKKFAQAERIDNSAAVKQQMQERRRDQLNCSHQHADGHTHLAHTIENGKLANGPGYLLCQWCNGKIRPENEEVRKLDPQAIYDTALFNRLYQTLPSKEIFG